MSKSTGIRKCAILVFTIQFCAIIILWHFIRNMYSTRTNARFLPLDSVRRIEYNISMEQISKVRSSIYPFRAEYKWLFLSSYQIYRVMMDRHFFAQYYAAKRHPNIKATLWGIGFYGYNLSMNIEENIQHRFSSAGYFDVIYILGPYGASDIRSASRYSLIMMREHECWGYRCLGEIINNNISIFLQTYAYEIDLYHRSFSYNRVIAHSPTSAEPLIFYPPLALNSDTPAIRDIDVLVVGARHHFVYPIRTRVAEMIKKGLIRNSYVHEHPGYTILNNSLEQIEEQTRIYAALLRRAKIVVVDSSRYSYALSKFSEIPLSGCLILGDIPAEREDEFRRYIVPISMNMTDSKIISIIDYWITHDRERETRAIVGQRLVLNSYTWDHNIDISLQAIINYRRGQFGLFYNYPYKMKCVPLDNTDYKPSISKWCPEQLKGKLSSFMCECNQTGINYFDKELDLENWKAKGCDVNATNPQMYLVPSSLLETCNSHAIISGMVSATSSGSLCYCPSVEKTWRRSKICYVQNAALTISRYLACP